MMLLNASKRFTGKISSEMLFKMLLKTLILTLSFLTSIRFNHDNLLVQESSVALLLIFVALEKDLRTVITIFWRNSTIVSE